MRTKPHPRRNIRRLMVLGLAIFSLFVIRSFKPEEGPDFEIPVVYSEVDYDNDGVDDYRDIMLSAREQIGVVTEYDTSYYGEGFPPDDRGACADVLWRALEGAGYDFKNLIDSDIQDNSANYPSDPTRDPNIDFRRVRNIQIFLENNALSLTTEIIPGDPLNLQEWQPGDIITYDQIPGGLWHVAILSDKRNKDGVPYLIHNYGIGVQENDMLLEWPAEITGHYRWEL